MPAIKKMVGPGDPCEKESIALGVNQKDLLSRETYLLPALAWKTECA